MKRVTGHDPRPAVCIVSTDFEPDIRDVALGPLSRDMFKTILQRTIDYGFTDLLHDIKEERWFISDRFDYTKMLAGIVKDLLAAMWFVMASDDGEGQLPSFAFQQDDVTILACGARAGTDHGIYLTVTGPSRTQVQAAMKRVIPKLVEDQNG